MKLAILTSVIAAAVTAAAPVPAGAASVSAGLSVNDGRVAGHLTLVDHDRRGYRRRDHRRRGRYGHGRHGRRGRCQSWRYVHRRLHRRFGHVRLQRTVFNRRGHRIFIAHARNHYRRPLRVRYNACLGRVMKVTPLGRRHHRHRRHRRY